MFRAGTQRIKPTRPTTKLAKTWVCCWDLPLQVPGRIPGPVSICGEEQEGASQSGSLNRTAPSSWVPGRFEQNKSETPLPGGGEVLNVLRNRDEGTERGPRKTTVAGQNRQLRRTRSCDLGSVYTSCPQERPLFHTSKLNSKDPFVNCQS